MSANYQVTPEAEADLIEIWKYSAGEFGERQADRYLAQIEADVEQLAEGMLAGGVCTRLIPGAAPDLRYWKSGQHYLVFRHPEGKPLELLTMIHSRSQSRLESYFNG